MELVQHFLPGNTALVYHDGKLLALMESDKPYVLKVLEDGDLQTLGMLDYDKRLQHSFTAHPKIDPYTANAWEEDDEVVLITCRIENPDLELLNGPLKEKPENIVIELYEMKFNMKSGLASQKKLSAPSVDFPRVHECYTCRRLRKKYQLIVSDNDSGTQQQQMLLNGNTALIYHHGKLLALSEADKPYAIKVLEDGDLQTLGLLDYDKRLKHSFTAHPKVDPYTGEMFTFGYAHEPPYITYRVISKDGFMHDPVPITLPAPIMMHDFAITENYAIFMDLPLYFRPKEMVKENKLIFTFDDTKKARFGVLPRYAKNEAQIRWFELPNCFIFHNANAWEEGDEVVLITCRLENPDLDMVNGAVKEKLENFTNELYEMRFNMKTGLASQKKLSAPAVDFPRVNECYTGRKQRYVYGTILDSIAKVIGIVKFDLHAEAEAGKTKLEVGGNVKGIFDLGQGRFGSEAVYVPREPGTSSEEDDGYLIFFSHDEKTGKSAVIVIDAKTMSSDPVAVVELPHRVPYGFHAFFVTEEQLEEQAKL
ncbi:hypothetical protein Dsin_010978 [Dipteronia sinensis]|uniref:carotenoid 9,10-dioxygenase n=1 Tax=Dipteronia sinensis TaxID=43782 RepID=A0AAE0AU94_9ROSI|nr:hypothetical protein Dsin_010978 [Dipteronia sinensis]